MAAKKGTRKRSVAKKGRYCKKFAKRGGRRKCVRYGRRK